MAEDFIDRVEPAKLCAHLPAAADDVVDLIVQYFMIDFLNDPDTQYYGYETIGGFTFDLSILYAAALSTEEPPKDISRIEKYLSDNPFNKDQITGTAFSEFRDRVTERLA